MKPLWKKATTGFVLTTLWLHTSNARGPGSPFEPPRNTPPASQSTDQRQPIDVEELIGKWKGGFDGGAEDQISIRFKDAPPANTSGQTRRGSAPAPNALRRLVLVGKHDDWQGTYRNGHLTFIRKPTAAEMSDEAPDWARQQVFERAPSLTWSLDLE